MKLKNILFILTIFSCCQLTPALGANFKVANHKFNVNYDHHGLVVARDDGAYMFNLYGQFEADFFKFVNADNLLRSGSNINYSTIYFTGKIANVWQYLFSYSLSRSAILDASVLYHGFRNQIIQVGQFTPNVGFSNWSRHFDVNFLEWPLPVFTFSPGYPQGIHYNIHGKYLAADASVFSGSTLEFYSAKNPVGATGRIYFSPIHTATRMLHLGVANWWQRPNNLHTVVFATTPEVNSHGYDVLISTGPIPQVDYYNITSGEFAGVYGPWSLQAEYYFNRVHRNNPQADLNFTGYYATFGYFLTGESMSYAYPLGAFTYPETIKGKYGAFQILARYSNLDLTDKDIQGGKEDNISLGLNWFVNHFISFKLNVIHASARPAINGKNVNAMIYAARAQVQF